MNKISFWKKISLYFLYRKTILKNKKEIYDNSNLRIDYVNRIYTVINVPNELFEEPYNMRTSDINKISEPYITEYIKQVSIYLDNKGLKELYKLYNVEKVDKYSYLIIIGFSLFDTSKVAKSFLLKFVPMLLILIGLYYAYNKLF